MVILTQPTTTLQSDIDSLISQFLKENTPKNGYYQCPNCGEMKFSINKANHKFDCYSCHDTKAIYQELKIMYATETASKKATRPKQYKEWIYTDVNNNPLIKVTRTDDGNGKRSFSQKHWNGQEWINGYGNVKRENIAIYKYQEVREAFSNGEPIFIVEGEGCADALWQLGIPATTNIGGSGKWLPQHTQQLEGATVVLCPDRDQPGISHMETISKDFPDAKWLYAYPESHFWQNLPENQGLDVKDWIEEFGITAEQILDAIEDKRAIILKPENKIVPHPSFSPLSEAEIQNILLDLASERDTKRESEIESKLDFLAKQSLRNYTSIDKQYKQICAELDRARELEWAKDELKKITDHEKKIKHFDWSKVLPERMFKAFHSKSDSDRFDITYLIQPFMGVTSALLGSKVGVRCKNGEYIITRTGEEKLKGGWVEFPHFYNVSIADASEGKSNAFTSILDALFDLQDEEWKKYKESRKKLEEIKENWSLMSRKEKDELKDDPSVNPRLFELYQPRIYTLTQDETLASAKTRIAEQKPNQGVVWAVDELISLFGGIDKYISGGDGGGRQWLLESWSSPLRGGVGRKNKDDSVQFSKQTLSITGCMQPSVATKLLDPNFHDTDGLSSRMLITFPQKHPKYAIWEDKTVSLYSYLDATYQGFETLGQLDSQITPLSSDAKLLFIKQWEQFKRGVLRYSDENHAFATFLGKCPSHLLRLAIWHEILQFIDDSFDIPIENRQQWIKDNIPQEVGVQAMERAIAHLDYHISSFRLAQIKLCQSFSKETPLTTVQKRILDWANTQKEPFTSALVKNRLFRNAKGIKTPELTQILDSLAQDEYLTKNENKYLSIQLIGKKELIVDSSQNLVNSSMVIVKSSKDSQDSSNLQSSNINTSGNFHSQHSQNSEQNVEKKVVAENLQVEGGVEQKIKNSTPDYFDYEPTTNAPQTQSEQRIEADYNLTRSDYEVTTNSQPDYEPTSENQNSEVAIATSVEENSVTSGNFQFDYENDPLLTDTVSETVKETITQEIIFDIEGNALEPGRIYECKERSGMTTCYEISSINSGLIWVNKVVLKNGKKYYPLGNTKPLTLRTELIMTIKKITEAEIQSA